ncbi:unnamed protein product [Absidia cylindrospora]
MPVQNLVNQNQTLWKPDYIVEPNIHSTSSVYKLKNSIKRVVVIGAGPAGLPTAKVLKDEGLDVVIYERSPASGGTWIYNAQAPLAPDYPAIVPSQLVQPSLPPSNSTLPFEIVEDFNDQDVLRHAPPTPCYQSLRNNVATPLLKYKDLDWPTDTPWFTTHDKILTYLQDYSKQFGLDDITEFNTSLEKLTELPQQAGWKVLTKKVIATTLQDKNGDERKVIKHLGKKKFSTRWYYQQDTIMRLLSPTFLDFLNGNKGIPALSYIQSSIASLKVTKERMYSSLVMELQPWIFLVILVIGATLSINWCVNPNHGFDEKYRAFREEVKTWLPPNVKRVSAIKNILFTTNNSPDTATIELVDGTTLTQVDAIVICTGYLFNYHFLQELHDDDANISDGKLDEDKVLVKQDGSQLFNLHKDIFYIPNPTLSFIGVPFHIATFSFFEFQAYAVARVYSQSAFLPIPERMRSEWTDRLKRKGGGREFHALGAELEQDYIQDIVTWVNKHGAPLKKPLLEGHSQAWFDVKEKAFDALRMEFKQRLQLDPQKSQADSTSTTIALSTPDVVGDTN